MVNIFRLKEKIISTFYGKTLSPFLRNAGKNILINSPLKIDGFKNISIGDNVRIGYKTWLAGSDAISEDCHLQIGSGCVIGSYNHIFATKSIKIGDNVLTADKVYISDNLHNYEDINIPIIHQGVRQIQKVEIGDGTWIGENACIIGVNIGKNCVVGANSVVTKDVPDYSIVAGIPAKIIKKYDNVNKSWKKTNQLGNFIYE
tara:strand:+ start:192 stop:797 length:606 start_codon:yes stop_codon:yes gene_type:complete